MKIFFHLTFVAFRLKTGFKWSGGLMNHKYLNSDYFIILLELAHITLIYFTDRFVILMLTSSNIKVDNFQPQSRVESFSVRGSRNSVLTDRSLMRARGGEFLCLWPRSRSLTQVHSVRSVSRSVYTKKKKQSKESENETSVRHSTRSHIILLLVIPLTVLRQKPSTGLAITKK